MNVGGSQTIGVVLSLKIRLIYRNNQEKLTFIADISPNVSVSDFGAEMAAMSNFSKTSTKQTETSQFRVFCKGTRPTNQTIAFTRYQAFCF